MLWITGDLHGEFARLQYEEREHRWTEQDCLLICGDFGLATRDDPEKLRILDELARRPYTVCFIDGNHEDFPALSSFPVEMWQGGKIHRIRRNIIHLMRGQVFLLEGRKLFTMGGAYSMDRDVHAFWEEELPCPEEYHEAAANLAARDWQVDYVLTHTAPREIIRRLGKTPAPGDLELTGFLEYLMLDKLSYKHWYCGHLHQDRDVTENFSVLWLDVRPLD